MKQHPPDSRRDETQKPTGEDRLVVFLMSLAFFLLIFPGERLLHGQAVGWVVMIAVIGIPVVIVNILLPCSRWKNHRGDEKQP